MLLETGHARTEMINLEESFKIFFLKFWPYCISINLIVTFFSCFRKLEFVYPVIFHLKY